MTTNTKPLPYKMIKHNADTLTPIQIFQSLPGTKKFLLESSFKHEEKGQYSFIGADPYVEFSGSLDETTMTNNHTGSTDKRNAPVLSVFQKEFPSLDIDIPLPFFGGAIGYVGYDAIRSYVNIGTDLPDNIGMPDSHLMLYKNIIVFDHKEESVSLITINLDQQTEHVLDQRLTTLSKALNTSAAGTPLADEPVTFEPDMDKQQFMHNVAIAKEQIQNGDIDQVVLSQRMKAAMHGHPFTFYRKLRKANPSPYMFYIDFDDYVLLGASPESLVKTSGRDIFTNPIAGTRPRGATNAEDEALCKDLLADEKEVAEHQMLVDLSLEDLARVCEANRIAITEYMQIETYQHVSHMVSQIHGRLADRLSSIDALIACLPAGTVSGSPKKRAMQIINETEDAKRGAYAGGVGYINYNGDLNMALNIRSLIVKDHQAYLQAGAGIVNYSDPETEYNETLHKARSLMEVADLDVTY